ncbi:MAG: hypothetical protein ACTHNW_13610 [Mucilaginibacter sp.]
MKKKTTKIVVQPGKTETIKPETHSHHAPPPRTFLNFSVCDHSHGRVNRFPFGSGHDL